VFSRPLPLTTTSRWTERILGWTGGTERVETYSNIVTSLGGSLGCADQLWVERPGAKKQQCVCVCVCVCVWRGVALKSGTRNIQPHREPPDSTWTWPCNEAPERIKVGVHGAAFFFCIRALALKEKKKTRMPPGKRACRWSETGSGPGHGRPEACLMVGSVTRGGLKQTLKVSFFWGEISGTVEEGGAAGWFFFSREG